MSEDGAPNRVSVDDPTDAAYWARYFQEPVEKVREAVALVGDQPERVAKLLGKPFPNPQSGIV